VVGLASAQEWAQGMLGLGLSERATFPGKKTVTRIEGSIGFPSGVANVQGCERDRAKVWAGLGVR
jgi:hypothetical protein